MEKPFSTLRFGRRRVIYVALFVALWLLLYSSFPFPSPAAPSSSSPGGAGDRRAAVTCDPEIAPFYVYDLPPRFNAALLRRCRSLGDRGQADMCPAHVANRGLGQPLFRLSDLADSSEGTSWYATHQFAAEMVFHARAARHPCRTDDPDAALLFYIPFYAGLYASLDLPQLDGVRRHDAMAADLAAAVSSRRSFLRRAGRDHFLVVGRAAKEFPRVDDNLLRTPELANVTVLTVEHRQLLDGRNQFSIPYPSYFHPRAASEVADWQAELRSSERSHLFALVGAPPVGVDGATEISKQCDESNRCLHVACKPGSYTCRDPNKVLGAMQRAEFCLQWPGDSFADRSTFDAVLAGCIPVFFTEHDARPPYEWYLPERSEDWSIHLKPDQWGRIEQELGRIPKAEVDRMREAVVRMIPSLSYAHPDSTPTGLGFRDAVDVALVELTKLVRSSTEQQ